MSTYGEYLLHFKATENVWMLKYLGPNKEKTNMDTTPYPQIS
jgi:hypothetical protein